ncbi:hypothetical protein DL96DRAFT_1720223 [Flagelloscypha sp. PMI_526]|nr:hypothetical protein DL96DRAFT_1720223 [Flagelloscypha sp. PMI_526]
MIVGTAGNVAHKGIHSIALTLPGWGLSSPRPSGVPFHALVGRDTATLLSHLHPERGYEFFRHWTNSHIITPLIRVPPVDART